jgi:hypothetical protein
MISQEPILVADDHITIEGLERMLAQGHLRISGDHPRFDPLERIRRLKFDETYSAGLFEVTPKQMQFGGTASRSTVVARAIRHGFGTCREEILYRSLSKLRPFVREEKRIVPIFVRFDDSELHHIVVTADDESIKLAYHFARADLVYLLHSRLLMVR